MKSISYLSYLVNLKCFALKKYIDFCDCTIIVIKTQYLKDQIITLDKNFFDDKIKL